MKRLTLKDQPERPPVLYGKDRLVQDIKDFVGEGGLVAFEHGFQPIFNMWAVTDTKVKLRFAIGRQHLTEISLDCLSAEELTIIIIDLFRYQNWCHLHA